MKVLCVAEKNSIAKSVASSLSRKQFRVDDSNFKYVKNYSFQFEFPNLGACDVVMTAVSGHLMTKDISSDYGWGKVPPETLFSCPVVTRPSDKNCEKIIKNISNLAKSSDYLMIWTDCDREGEYIGWEILEAAKQGNACFDLDNTLRARFSHLEPKHVYHAACNPVKLDKRMIDAVDIRMELDLRTGFCFTRLLTNSFRNIIQSNDQKSNNKMVSYGNCQFPTLGFVVDRYKRIKHFKSERYWSIHINIRKNRKKYTLTWDQGHLFDRLQVVALYQNCINENSDKCVVKNIYTKPISKYSPLPLTTVEMQKDCAKFFKMSAKDILNTAESLYTKGFISYPRTETDSFPKNMDFKHFIEMQKQSSEWGQYATSLLDNNNNYSNKFRQPRRGKHDDEAHPPIHPVLFVANLTGKERNVYEYIVRRFLAACSLDAKGQTTKINIQWGTETFSISGLVVTERNFLEVYKWGHWETSKKELPQLDVGERINVVDPKIVEGSTTPPEPLTESDLIALMDINGIGTDATIADHIETIIQREYIVKSEKQTGRSKKEIILPTVLGYGLADGFSKLEFDNLSLTKPFMRKDMEADLTNVCQGNKIPQDVVKNTLMIYREAYDITLNRMGVLTKAYKDALISNKD